MQVKDFFRCESIASPTYMSYLKLQRSNIQTAAVYKNAVNQINHVLAQLNAIVLQRREIPRFVLHR